MSSTHIPFSKLRVLILFFIYILGASPKSAAQTLEKHLQLTEVKELMKAAKNVELAAPVISPDGKYFIYTEAGFLKLFLKKIDSDDKAILIDSMGAGWRPVWSLDAKKIFYREKKGSRLNNDVKLKAYEVKTGLKTDFNNVNPDAIFSYPLAKKDRHPLVFINYKTTQLEAESKDKSKHWIISTETGLYFPLLSPDRKYVAVHHGPNIWVYKTDGSGLDCKFGAGLATAWSPDSKRLIGFIETGQSAPGSELYIYNIESATSYRLTDTKNIHEMYPSWSSDGKKILFSDDHTGSIYTANIIQIK